MFLFVSFWRNGTHKSFFKACYNGPSKRNLTVIKVQYSYNCSPSSTHDSYLCPPTPSPVG